MSLERNKKLARAAITIWSTGDFSRVFEIFTPDQVMHQHHDAIAGRTGDLGLKALRAFAHEFRIGFSDFHDTIDLQLAESDLVATRFTLSGTHTGHFGGIAPTGRKPSCTGVIDRVKDDRIVESWCNWDIMGLLQPLGVIPPQLGTGSRV